MGPGTLPKGLAVLLGLAVAGAGGTTGITRGAQSKPDGYTIMMGHMGTHGAAPARYANLKYDPVGGQVDYLCDQIVNLVEQVKGGSIKAYAIASAERSPALPNVPTTKEAGRSPQALSGLVKSEVARWTPILKSAQITP